MGCAALRIQDWDIAIKAFNRVVTMDRDNGEAWTNLASVFIKQKKKREAWRAIREALRSKYDASNIWENYLYVSVDVHEYAEAMRAMERVLEIRLDRVTDKKRLVDIEILSILIQAVTHPLAPSTLTSTSEAEDESLQARLVAKLSALLDTIHSKVASPEIFTESAKFYESQGLFRKALEFRLKAYRALLHSPSLQNDRGVFEQLGQTTLDLVEAFERLGPLSEPERMTGESVPVCSDWSYQSTTCLKTVVGRTRKTFEDTSLFETMLSKWEALKGK